MIVKSSYFRSSLSFIRDARMRQTGLSSSKSSHSAQGVAAWRPNSAGKVEPLLCHNFKCRYRVRALDRLFKLFLCGRVFARFEELPRFIPRPLCIEQTHLRIITYDERLFLAEILVAVPKNFAAGFRDVDVRPVSVRKTIGLVCALAFRIVVSVSATTPSIPGLVPGNDRDSTKRYGNHWE